MFIRNDSFWKVFKNTAVLGGLTLLFSFPLPIIFALLLNEVKNEKFKRFVQTTSYLPHFLSIVIVSGMILEMLARNGIINIIIFKLTGKTINLMQDPIWFRTIYVVSHVWQSTGWGYGNGMTFDKDKDEFVYMTRTEGFKEFVDYFRNLVDNDVFDTEYFT